MVAVTVLAMGSTMLFPADASAKGSFTWTARMYSGIVSRNWYQNAGTTTITHYLPCSGNYGTGYNIVLIKDMVLDKYYATKYYECGKTHTSTWYNTQNGTYKFKINHYQFTYIDAKGTVSYQ